MSKWFQVAVKAGTQATSAQFKGHKVPVPVVFSQRVTQHTYAFEGPRGAYYVALPTHTEGVYKVMSLPSARVQCYAKVVDGVLVPAPEYK